MVRYYNTLTSINISGKVGCGRPKAIAIAFMQGSVMFGAMRQDMVWLSFHA